jgi:hypothetical protein
MSHTLDQWFTSAVGHALAYLLSFSPASLAFNPAIPSLAMIGTTDQTRHRIGPPKREYCVED